MHFSNQHNIIHTENDNIDFLIQFNDQNMKRNNYNKINSASEPTANSGNNFESSIKYSHHKKKSRHAKEQKE